MKTPGSRRLSAVEDAAGVRQSIVLPAIEGVISVFLLLPPLSPVEAPVTPELRVPACADSRTSATGCLPVVVRSGCSPVNTGQPFVAVLRLVR